MLARSAARQALYIAGLSAISLAVIVFACGLVRLRDGAAPGFLCIADILPLDGAAGAVWLWAALAGFGALLLMAAGRRRRRIFHHRKR